MIKLNNVGCTIYVVNTCSYSKSYTGIIVTLDTGKRTQLSCLGVPA